MPSSQDTPQHGSAVVSAGLAPLPIAQPPPQTASLGAGHPAPDTLGLVGGECVLKAEIGNRTDGADAFGSSTEFLVLADREKDARVGTGAGGVLTPILVRLPHQIAERHHHMLYSAFPQALGLENQST